MFFGEEGCVGSPNNWVCVHAYVVTVCERIMNTRDVCSMYYYLILAY